MGFTKEEIREAGWTGLKEMGIILGIVGIVVFVVMILIRFFGGEFLLWIIMTLIFSFVLIVLVFILGHEAIRENRESGRGD